MVAKVRPLFDYDKAQHHPAPSPLPHNLDVERAVLGAILLNNKCFDQVATALAPQHFYSPVHGRLYAEITKRIVANTKADLLTISQWFEQDTQQDQIQGGAKAYLISLCGANSVMGFDIATYGAAVRDDFIRREIIAQTAAITVDAHDRNVNIVELVTRATTAIDAAAVNDVTDGSKSFDAVMAASIAKAKAALESGVSSWIQISGFPRLNRIISFQPTQLTLLGGRQGEGKSALMFGWAVDAARALKDSGLPITTTGGIVVISLDMSDEMVGDRALAAVAGLDVNDVVERRLNERQVQRLEEAAEELQGLPLQVISGSNLTASVLKMRVRQAKRKLGGIVRFIGIDHFTLAAFERGGDRGNPSVAYDAMANEFHSWCKKDQFNCHVVCLVQLKLGEIAQREDKTPTRSDIKWGGALVSNADNVLFAYRPIMDLSKTPPKKHEGEHPADHKDRIRRWENERIELKDKAFLIVDKARSGNGEVEAIALLFDGRHTHLSEDPSQRLEDPTKNNGESAYV